MDARISLGRRGEELACELFEGLGFSRIDRNYRCAAGEIDIVASRAGMVVFCEVKTRRTDRWGEPSQAVNHGKRARLRRLAALWLREHDLGRVDIRFDVVSVIVSDDHVEAIHIPDAF